VRWGCFERATDGFQNAIEVIKHVIVPKPDDAVAVTRKLGGAPIIGLDALAVLAAVELDDQLACGTSEVGDALSDGMPPAKFPKRDTFAQGSPEHLFDIRGVSSQAPRGRCSRFQGHQKPHLTPPLRPNGAERGGSWHVLDDGASSSRSQRVSACCACGRRRRASRRRLPRARRRRAGARTRRRGASGRPRRRARDRNRCRDRPAPRRRARWSR